MANYQITDDLQPHCAVDADGDDFLDSYQSILVNSSGEEIGISDNPLQVEVASGDPATSALQTTGNTTLASILAKIITAPATEAKQDDVITSLASILTALADPATQTTLAAVLAKLSDDPATAALQSTGNTSLASILNQLQSGTPVTLNGSLLQEQKTQADAVSNVITFSVNITAIEIYHEESTWQEFGVNGLTLHVPAGGYRTLIGGTPAATVTIPSGINCIVGRLS
jgi:hypothetical protein